MPSKSKSTGYQNPDSLVTMVKLFFGVQQFHSNKPEKPKKHQKSLYCDTTQAQLPRDSSLKSKSSPDIHIDIHNHNNAPPAQATAEPASQRHTARQDLPPHQYEDRQWFSPPHSTHWTTQGAPFQTSHSHQAPYPFIPRSTFSSGLRSPPQIPDPYISFDDYWRMMKQRSPFLFAPGYSYRGDPRSVPPGPPGSSILLHIEDHTLTPRLRTMLICDDRHLEQISNWLAPPGSLRRVVFSTEDPHGSGHSAPLSQLLTVRKSIKADILEAAPVEA